jgi:hypothetical protein
MNRWKDEIIAAAKKWPRSFRARLDTGTWQLLGANEDAQQEFRVCAKRIWRELGFPPGDVDPVTGLLYRLKEEGHYPGLSQQPRKHRIGSGVVISNRQRATLYSIGSALIEYLSQQVADSPNAKPRPRAPARSSGQAAAAQKNREREVRELIVRALQKSDGTSHAKWPDFIQEFLRSSDQKAYRQPISPALFQPPAFDRLNQSPEDWVKAADAGGSSIATVSCERARSGWTLAWMTKSGRRRVPVVLEKKEDRHYQAGNAGIIRLLISDMNGLLNTSLEFR